MNSRGDGRLLMQGAATYVVLGFVQNAINFLLLPGFVHALSPDQYGQIGLLLTLGALSTVIASLCLDVAVFRGHFRYIDEPAERIDLLGSLMRFLVVFPLATGLSVSVLLFGLGGRPLGFYPAELALGLLGPCLLVAGTVAPLSLLRAEQRFADYSKLVGTQLLVQVSLKIALVIVFGQGVRGWVLADVIAGVVMLPIGIYLMKMPWRGRIVANRVTTSLSLTLPLLPHRLSHWGLALSDRLVLVTLVSAASLGRYTLGYQIAAVVGLVLTQINQAIMPFYGKAIRSSGAAASLAAVATVQALLTAYLGFAMALVGPLFVLLLLPATYSEAATLIPLVALGQLLFGLYFIPTNALSIIDGDTNWLWLPSLLSALVNVVLNLWLVPFFGLVAAAANTAASYLVLLVLVTAIQHRRGRTRIRLAWGRLVCGLAILGGCYALANSPWSSGAPLPSLFLRITLLVISGLLLLKVSGARQLLEPPLLSEADPE